MSPIKTEIHKKGSTDNEYILIELEDIEEKTGRIINQNRAVNEIGSDKKSFESADLITSKMRPYLGYTITNAFDENFIGTTELLTFKVNEEKPNLNI
jgi:hypothetical protein